MAKNRNKNPKSTTRNRDKKQDIFPNELIRDEEENLYASAIIKEGIDTPILQKDLIREFQPNKNNTDQSFLVNDTWVRFFDHRSSFLKGLMALVQNSTTLRNILNKKTTLTMGDGFLPIEGSKVPFLQNLRMQFKKLFAGESGVQAMNDLVGKVNLNNETLEEVIEKVAFDWWAFGNAIVELVKAKRDGKDIVYIYHIPLHKAGIHKANKDNIIEYIGVSDDWDFSQGSDDYVNKIPIYPEFNSKKRSAIHIKNYAPGFFYWGLPANIAARFWAEIEYRIPQYNISKFDNGFILSAIVQAYGNMTPTEAKKLVKKFQQTFTGTGNNSKVLYQVVRDEKYKTDVTTLEDKSEGKYLELQKLATQAIITGNEWEPSLSGIEIAGKLGNNQQIRDSLELVKNTTIKQAQRKIMNSIVNPFIKENSEVNSNLRGIMLKIANLNPISLASLLKPDQVLTKDEQRDILGFEPLEGTDQEEQEEEISEEGEQPENS